jgi:hypothetical protein
VPNGGFTPKGDTIIAETAGVYIGVYSATAALTVLTTCK